MKKNEFKITTYSTELRKWDIVRHHGGGESIVINVQPTMYGQKTTHYPFKKKKTKFGQWLWFKILKLKIFLRIIKID